MSANQHSHIKSEAKVTTGSNLDAIVDSSDIKAMKHRYRTNLINSLSGFKSANLIGTQSAKGITNLALFSSVVHLGADPALVGLIARPPSVERHTFENILDTGAYTINQVSANIVDQAHQTSARYAKGISEFERTGLTEQYTSLGAPYVAQCEIKYGVALKSTVPIELNNTVLIVGEIVELICPPDYVHPDGKINLISANTCAVSGLDEYHTTQSLGRRNYAKP